MHAGADMGIPVYIQMNTGKTGEIRLYQCQYAGCDIALQCCKM